MTDPAEGKAQENEKSLLNEESATNAVIDIPDEVDPDDSKAHLISTNGNAGGDLDHLPAVDVKIINGTATSSEAEVSFNGLGKDEVMKYAEEPFWKRLRLILFILFWLGWFAMLVTAIIIIVLAPRCPHRPSLKWYQTDVIYQVLPKSFKDSNGDGVGDFQGLKNKADYVFDEVGAKAIWLDSVYLTDDKESGLGIIDHKALAPWFNATTGDLKGWIKSLMKEDKRVILDLIPTQTSKKHEWFEKSRRKTGKYANYYVWASGNGNQPPNNWKSAYNGSAWKYDDERKEYYLHQLSEDHPYLNLQNEDVLEEIKEIMRFWLNVGVSGFHVRGVEFLAENALLMDNDVNKNQTFNYKGSMEILEEMRKVVDEFSDKPGRERVLFATVTSTSPEILSEYWGPPEARRLHIVTAVMELLNTKVNSTELVAWMDGMLSDEGNQWLGLALGSDSVSRIASRMMTPKKLTIAHALQMLLPGTPFNYYGDEFGQKNVDNLKGSDSFRTPMQWSSGINAGFTSGTPYLPVGQDYKENHVDASSALFSEETPFKFFKKLIKLREAESFQFGKTKACAPMDDLMLFTRQAERFPYFLTIINLGGEKTISLDAVECVQGFIKEMGTVKFHSAEKFVGEALNFKEIPIKIDEGAVIVVEFSA